MLIWPTARWVFFSDKLDITSVFYLIGVQGPNKLYKEEAMKVLGVAILLFFAAGSSAAFDIGGELGRAVKNVEKEIAKNPSAVSKEVANAVKDVSKNIERAALVQSATESALASRIQFLEATVRSQSEVISEFKLLVSALKKEIEDLKNNE